MTYSTVQYWGLYVGTLYGGLVLYVDKGLFPEFSGSSRTAWFELVIVALSGVKYVK